MKIKHESLFKVLLFFNLFFPTFNSVLERTGSTGVIIINFTLFSSILIYLSYIYVNFRRKLDGVELIFGVVFMLYALNIMVTGFFNRQVVSSDLFELFRPAFYFCNFLLGYNLIRLNIISVERFVALCSLGILATACFSLLNIIFYDVFGRSIMAIYAKDTLLPGRRFAGTFQNPYDFAFISALPFSYYLMKFITVGKIKYVMALLVILISIAFGQSKSGFVTVFLVAFIQIALIRFYVGKKNVVNKNCFHLRLYSFPFLLFLVVSFAYIVYGEQFQYLVNGLTALSSGGDRSSQIRLEQLYLALSMLENNWFNLLFGFGSYKQSGLMFESLYSLYFFRYGVFGLVLLLTFVLLPLCLLCTRLRYIPPLTRLVLLLFVFAVLPSGIGNNVIDQSRIPFIFFMTLGVVFFCASQCSSLNAKVIK